jgi:protein-S-isoprenylcysteine O-methyltransferase Ste14
MRDSWHIVPIAVLWMAWLAYWFVAARATKHEVRRESAASRAMYIVPMTAGGVLLAFHHLPADWLYQRFLPTSAIVYWAGIALLVAGLALSVWARRHLGSNWSAAVTLKRDHELIRTGPYRFVRHPIYSGLLLAIVGTALTVDEWRALIAVVLIAGGLVAKMRTEDRFLADLFQDEYARYRAKVPALIPRLWGP